LARHRTEFVPSFEHFSIFPLVLVGDCEFIYPVKLPFYLMSYQRSAFLDKFYSLRLFNNPAM
jgi:hypothetical protein